MSVSGYKYDAFLSHNWGDDRDGRDNHARVQAIGDRLKTEFNILIWLDHQQLFAGDHVWRHLTEGVSESPIFAVFITQAYIDKASGNGPKGLNDNVYHEFSAACQRNKIIIPIMMEPDIDWRGYAGTVLYPLLRIYLTTDESIDQNIAILAEAMQRKLATVTSRVEQDPVGVTNVMNLERVTSNRRTASNTSRSSSSSCSPIIDYFREIMSLGSHNRSNGYLSLEDMSIGSNNCVGILQFDNTLSSGNHNQRNSFLSLEDMSIDMNDNVGIYPFDNTLERSMNHTTEQHDEHARQSDNTT